MSDAPMTPPRSETVEVPVDWDLVSRKAVVALCDERAAEHAELALTGEPDNARSRESAEAAFRAVQYAVAFMPAANGASVGAFSARPTAAETGVIAFARAILHGDDEHREWLLAAADAFVGGRALPSPNGLGRTEAAEREVASLRAKLAEAERRYETADRDLSEVYAAIGGVEFMDPPDGGDVSLAEQVRRMRAKVAELAEACSSQLSEIHELVAGHDTVLATRDATIAARDKRIAEVETERDAAREAGHRDAGLWNSGGLRLLYEIRAAIGWNDKTSLDLLPAECARLHRAAQKASPIWPPKGYDHSQPGGFDGPTGAD